MNSCLFVFCCNFIRIQELRVRAYMLTPEHDGKRRSAWQDVPSKASFRVSEAFLHSCAASTSVAAVLADRDHASSPAPRTCITDQPNAATDVVQPYSTLGFYDGFAVARSQKPRPASPWPGCLPIGHSSSTAVHSICAQKRQ